MKKVISLVIAIAVMISMFVIPASAAAKSWHHCLDAVNGAVSGSGGTGPSVAASNLSGYAGNVGCIFSFVGWVQPDEGQTVEKFVVSKDNGSTWEDTTFTTKDRSAELARLVGFDVSLATEGQAAGSYTDVIGVVVDGVTYEMINFSYSLIEAGVLSDASQIVPGTTKLTQDISGALNVTSGTYVIDLAGYTWSHNNVALTVGGTADVTVKDSVGGGKIAVRPNDATQVDGGKLTFDNVTVSADGGGMDAIFVNAGTVIVKKSTLIATKAGIDVSQNGDSATIIVDGATFGVYEGEEDPSRSCAIEFRNSNKDIELKGDIKFENNLILRRDVGTETPSDVASLFDFGEGSSATFSEDGEVIQDRWTPNTIEYSYEAPETPVEPETPVDPEEPVKDKNVLYVSYDEIKPGILCGGKDENIKTPVLEAGTKEATFWGWVALAKNVKSFSYSINGGEKVDQPAAVVAAEQPVLDAVAKIEGAVTGSRFQVVVPVTDGTQTIEIFAEFEDGTSESFWKADLTVGEPTGDVETGDFMSFAFVIAAAAVVVTVLSKKRAF